MVEIDVIEPGPGQALVRTRASSMCNHPELWSWRGGRSGGYGSTYPMAPGEPGHEAVGEVVVVGLRVEPREVVVDLASGAAVEVDVTRAARHDLFAAGERRAKELGRRMRERIDKEPSARIDYAEIVRPDTLERAGVVEAGDVALAAVFIGTTRLIDNVEFSMPEDRT